MVPKGWKKGLVSDLADTVMGYAFKSNDFVKKGIPLVRMGNLYQNQFQLDRSPIYLPDDFATEYKRFLLQSGDLVMSMTGTMGKRDYGFAVEIPENTQDCLLNQRVLKIEPRNSDAKGFVLNVLKSEIFLSKLYSLPGGTKQANLSATQIREISVLIPPLPEQQKIAKILSTWDKAISMTERLIDNSTQQKKALMQQLLTGKKRLLDESGKRFAGEWESLTIGDVVELFNGYAFKSSDALEKGYKWLKIANVGIGEIKWDNSSYLPEGYENEYNRFNLKVGDVVVAMTRPTLGNQLKIARLKNKDDESLLNQRVAKLLFSEKVSSEYMYQLLSTIGVALKLNHALLGTDPPNLSTKVLHEISMELPPLIEQQKIATVLTNADKEIELLEQQLADLQQEKKALMQALLTGKKRVVVD